MRKKGLRLRVYFATPHLLHYWLLNCMLQSTGCSHEAPQGHHSRGWEVQWKVLVFVAQWVLPLIPSKLLIFP